MSLALVADVLADVVLAHPLGRMSYAFGSPGMAFHGEMVQWCQGCGWAGPRHEMHVAGRQVEALIAAGVPVPVAA